MRVVPLCAALLLASIAPLAAADLPSREAPVLPVIESAPGFMPYFSVGPTIGTTGLGVEAGYRMNEYFGARAQLSYMGGLNYSGAVNSQTVDSIDYDVKPDWLNSGVMLDVHPFANLFRVTGGARIGAPDVAVTGSGSGTVNVGGTDYTGDVRIKAALDYDMVVMPYLGLGAEGSPFGNNILVGFDVGAFYTGNPDVRLRQTGGSVTVSQADLDREAKDITDDIEKINFFPMVQLSVKYRF